MEVNNDFEIVESTRGGTLDKRAESNSLQDSLADNMGSIIEIAQDITDIKRMQVQSDAILAKMAEDRKMLLAESEAYARRKGIDTDAAVQRMKIVRELLQDFYRYNENNNSALSGSEFTQIISDVLSKME